MVLHELNKLCTGNILGKRCFSISVWSNSCSNERESTFSAHSFGVCFFIVRQKI